MEAKPAARKDRHKQTRKRLDQVNQAAKRCRQRQKAQLLYLRQRVQELEGKLNQVNKQSQANKFSGANASEANDEGTVIKEGVSDTESLVLNNILDQNLSCKEKSSCSLQRLTLIEKASPLINQIQVHTSILKEQLGHYFVYANVLYHRGFHIQPIITEKSSSFYMTKFFPNATVHICDGSLLEILASTGKQQIDEILEVINDNTIIGNIPRMHEEKIFKIPVLMMKWMEDDEIIFSSETIPTIVPCDDHDIRSYSARTWFAKHVVNNVSGICVTRYIMHTHHTSNTRKDTVDHVQGNVIRNECRMLEAFDQSILDRISRFQILQQQQMYLFN